MKPTPYTRHKRPLNSTMNVVPYIDVMLVLLIIFMVTAPMLTTGVKIDLPKEKTAALASDKQLPVIISLRADGQLFLSTQNASDEALDQAVLLDKLRSLAQAQTDDHGQSTLQVLVNADSKNDYQSLMTLLATLQQAGINHIGLVSAAPDSTPTKKAKHKKSAAADD